MRLSVRRFAVLIGCAVVVLLAAGCSTPSPDASKSPAGGPSAAPGGAEPANAPSGRSGSSGVASGATAASPAVPAAPAPAPPPPARRFTLAAGTVIGIVTTHGLSTNTQSSGDTFTASLAEPIVDGDWVVAKQGAEVEGLVVSSSKGGRVKGRAELGVAVTAITLTDGQRLPVTTQLARSTARSSKGSDAGKIAVTTGVGAAIGAIAGGGKGLAIGAAAGGAGGTALVLGTRGKPAEIPARTLLHFKVQTPVEIVEKK